MASGLFKSFALSGILLSSLCFVQSLKLEPDKRPADLIVIDAIEHPTPN